MASFLILKGIGGFSEGGSFPNAWERGYLVDAKLRWTGVCEAVHVGGDD